MSRSAERCVQEVRKRRRDELTTQKTRADQQAKAASVNPRALISATVASISVN